MNVNVFYLDFCFLPFGSSCNPSCSNRSSQFSIFSDNELITPKH